MPVGGHLKDRPSSQTREHPLGRELRVSIIFYNFTKTFQIPYLISVSENPGRQELCNPFSRCGWAQENLILWCADSEPVTCVRVLRD